MVSIIKTIELKQRVQGSDETVEQYVSVLQKLFTRVRRYNKAQKTQKFISGLTQDLYIMVQLMHDGTFQNIIIRTKRCEMTLMTRKNKNKSKMKLKKNNRSGNNNNPTGGNTKSPIVYYASGHIIGTSLEGKNVKPNKNPSSAMCVNFEENKNGNDNKIRENEAYPAERSKQST
ncbi:hypothetical protein RhiirA4_461804 [Rhizophagus irregularis]|uniref:Retrotransposon gag domain-containing protein n=1 Tax=Rhizophagus irregularis TaxID=588596 RepID=A0A2I1GJL0_9GLOM|nr:hypothetical protein RhiirA4_461804 [Rhizophagus irregularis]